MRVFSRSLALYSKVLCLVALALVLPLCGAFTAGLPFGQLLEFPPRSSYIEHAAFSWEVFALYALGTAAAVGPFIARVFSICSSKESRSSRKKFPAYGWAGLILIAAGWTAAWTRLPYLHAVQRHTFIPLWFGYVLFVMALAQRNHRNEKPRGSERRFWILFPASAIFWWYFEYLNRFVQNWRYENVETFGAGGYFFFATLSFSTVLPAVAVTHSLLRQNERLERAFKRFVALPAVLNPRCQGAALLLSMLALLFLPLAPNILFPAVWVSPTVVALVVLERRGVPGFLAEVARGDWRETVVWAVSALVCGFLWEMWNFWSLARWVYQIPYVSAFHLFEMPFLGYAGYLPFGILCGAAVRWISGEGGAERG